MDYDMADAEHDLRERAAEQADGARLAKLSAAIPALKAAGLAPIVFEEHDESGLALWHTHDELETVIDWSEDAGYFAQVFHGLDLLSDAAHADPAVLGVTLAGYLAQRQERIDAERDYFDRR